ncbi:unnamed protein product [Clavelina lepadiformis]|uniref:Uncharacterized protein n=1 Tax=Clavelina lepadiformis TaxID=159417 RepID=A0ABP0FQC4_CLALP
MHHHPQNQERALNLSILTVSGPGFATILPPEPKDFGFPKAAGEVVKANRCFEHSNFFKVNVPAAANTQSRAPDGEPKGLVRVLHCYFFVTTSPRREWVICAPAAFLGSGSRFSGSLSGIEP